MKRARVWKIDDGQPDPWVVFVMGEDWLRKAENDFPTHAAALAHALAAVGLVPDPDPSRCPMRATDPITTRHPREDGWRCGHEAGHSGGHTLYSAEGESVLYADRWVHPAGVGLTEKED